MRIPNAMRRKWGLWLFSQRRGTVSTSVDRQGIRVSTDRIGGVFYPWWWLRESPAAPEHRLASGQKLFNSTAVEALPPVLSHDSHALSVQWQDGVASRYPWEFF